MFSDRPDPTTGQSSSHPTIGRDEPCQRRDEPCLGPTWTSLGPAAHFLKSTYVSYSPHSNSNSFRCPIDPTTTAPALLLSSPNSASESFKLHNPRLPFTSAPTRNALSGLIEVENSFRDTNYVLLTHIHIFVIARY